MAILNNSNAISSAGGYDINNSLRFRRGASAFLNRTPASASNRKTFTYSAWIKRGLSGNNNFFCVNPNTGFSVFSLNFDLNVSGDIGVYQNTSGTNTLVVSTNALFRDFSAWYHVVVAIDTTQATAANRVLIYVNGVSQSLTISTQVALNTDLYVNSTLPHTIGKEQTASGGSGNYFDGYMAEINFIDGSAKTPSDFGETDTTTGSWKPKAYTGTYGTNGFYLKFSDIATTSGSNAGLGKDFSGNANYFNTNNISVTAGTTYDAMIDSPTLTSATVANYCVLNPLDIIPSRTLPVISGGNLDASNGGSGDDLAHGTIAVSSGKWYFEMVAGTVPGSTTHFVGWQVPVPSPINGGLYRSNGVIYDFSATTTSAPTYTANDIIGCIIDVDAGKVWFSKNGTYVNSGDPAAGTNPAYTFTAGSLVTPALAFDNIASTCTASVNFGQRPFSYTPPTGFVALNTYNLPTPTVLKGNKYMDATTWTGTGVARSITNAGSFSPDFIWVKQRSSTENHQLVDTVRGYDKYLNSNLTDAEATNTNRVTAFNSDGFSLGTATSVNTNTATYVGWQWQAGQGSTSSNTQGSITSTVSVNTTAGFSIVTYTGTGSNATVGHGLGVAPSMMIIKQRNSTQSWSVYHASLGATKRLYLDLTNAVETTTTAWNSTAPTSSVYSVGTSAATNGNGNTFVAYCWSEIAGFSKFGSYTGNGSTDGPFVYLGFRPKYVIIKCTNDISHWTVEDSSRSSYNVATASFYTDTSGAESTSIMSLDFLSNGFKCRNVLANESNVSGYTYIYAAFAENPFKNSLAR